MSPGLGVLLRATRAKILPLVLAPVGVGAGFALDRGAAFRPAWFLATATGAAALALGGIVLNDYADERAGVDGIARMDRTSIVTGAGLIAAKVMTPRAMLALAGALWGIAAGIGILIAVARTPAVLGFGAAGAVLAYGYAGPPVRYGYRGLGPVGIALVFGPLLVGGAATATAGRLDAAALWVGVAPGLLGAGAFAHADLLHWRADRTAGKRTPASIWGPEGGLAAGGAAITAAAVVLTVQAATRTLPMWCLVALPSMAPVAASWVRAARDPIAQNALGVFGASLGAAVLTGTVMAIALAT